MKGKIFILVLSTISFNFANAQFAENHAVYTTGEMNFGNYFGGDLNLNYVYKEKYAFKLGCTLNLRKPGSQPDDFSTGVTGILIFGLNSPADQFLNFGAGLGRVYKINQNGTIRIVPFLGVGYTIYTEPDNWVKTDNSFVHLTENYSYDYVDHKAVSLIVNPKLEFPVTRFWGLTVSPMLQINKAATYFGVGLGSMIGLLR
ncbi:MAG: hypothetical protein GX180_12935 [Enterococcus sp.]|nr:hypothetical protein [Enterococcus sp.]